MSDIVYLNPINLSRFKKENLKGPKKRKSKKENEEVEKVEEEEVFDLFDESNKGALELLTVTFDETIIAADREKMQPYLDLPEIKEVREGRKPMPMDFPIKNEDDFWKILAHRVDLEDY